VAFSEESVKSRDAILQNSNGRNARKSAEKIVSQIQRADYEGDRDALKRLFDEMEKFADDQSIGSKVRYWRGFAMWRRAFNGTSASGNELELDLQLAVREFDMAIGADPAFIDAKVAEASCLQNLGALRFIANDLAPAREFMQRSFPLLKDAEAAQPNNPRLLWVLGAYQFYNPAKVGGGQALAIETYHKGLMAFRASNSKTSDALTPSWGEPELLMSLAFSNLNKKTPEPAVAEHYAQRALALVPYWHYVRDQLLPQIKDALNRNANESRTSPQ